MKHILTFVGLMAASAALHVGFWRLLGIFVR
jgi:hypothetical protein